MIGPAEIEDLMLEYADAVAAEDEARGSGARDNAPRAWSWGLGPMQASCYGPCPPDTVTAPYRPIAGLVPGST